MNKISKIISKPLFNIILIILSLTYWNNYKYYILHFLLFIYFVNSIYVFINLFKKSNNIEDSDDDPKENKNSNKEFTHAKKNESKLNIIVKKIITIPLYNFSVILFTICFAILYKDYGDYLIASLVGIFFASFMYFLYSEIEYIRSTINHFLILFFIIFILLFLGNYFPIFREYAIIMLKYFF